MNKSLFETASKAVWQFEQAGGEICVTRGRINFSTDQPDAPGFRTAWARLEKRKPSVKKFLQQTRGAGPALQDLWEEDAELQAEWVTLGLLESACELIVFSLIDSL